MATKYIFVTGGVLSGLGKGVVAASLGNLLQRHGLKVYIQKFDPYLNVDAGTLNPAEHGECFVTADGAECDLDLGHYERFLNIELSRHCSTMSGEIYQQVIDNERHGQYLGKTVQVIPHITDEIKRRLYLAAKESRADVILTEIGGTIGDIESAHFVEAIRQVSHEKNGDTLFVHLGYLPYIATSEELKTKPIQNSVVDLRERGIHPDLLFCRSDYPVSNQLVEKIAMFAGLKEEAVIPLETASCIYHVPEFMRQHQVDLQILRRLRLKPHTNPDRSWQRFIRRINQTKKTVVRIGLVGKYMSMKDTYFSVTEALMAAAWANNVGLEIIFIDSEQIEKSGIKVLQNAKLDGLCAPGGFGKRGIEGIISAIRWARTNSIPFLGLCLGLQLAVIEYARHQLKISGAGSTEFGRPKDPVIDLMESQTADLFNSNYGATMRLGNFDCQLTKGSLARKLYRSDLVQERHRHRYEFNNAYRERFEEDGELRFSGFNPQLNLVEIIELKNHPYFIACQFHPEFRSRPNIAHPLFEGLIKSVKK